MSSALLTKISSLLVRKDRRICLEEFSSKAVRSSGRPSSSCYRISVRYSTVVFSPSNPYKLESLANYTYNFDLLSPRNDGTEEKTGSTGSKPFTTGGYIFIKSRLTAGFGSFLSCSYMVTRS